MKLLRGILSLFLALTVTSEAAAQSIVNRPRVQQQSGLGLPLNQQVADALPQGYEDFTVYPNNTLLADGADAHIVNALTPVNSGGNLTTLYYKRPRVIADGSLGSGSTTPTAAGSSDSPQNTTGGIGVQALLRNTGSANHWFEFERTAASMDVYAAVAATNEVDAVTLHINDFGWQIYQLNTTGSQLTSGSVVATSRQAWPRAPKNGDRYRGLTYAGKAYYYRNGVSQIAAGIAHARTGTNWGIGTFQDGLRRTNKWKWDAAPGRLAITNDGGYANANNWRFYARKKDFTVTYPKGYRDITFAGSYEGFASGLSIQWALFDPATDAQLTNWANPQSATIAAGNWSLVARVPAGVETTVTGADRRTGYPYSLTLADGRALGAGVLPYSVGFRAVVANRDSGIWIRTRHMISVAANFVMVGQSNDQNQANNTNTGVNVPDHPGIGQYIAAYTPSTITPTYAANVTGWDASTTETVAGGVDKVSGWYQLIADALNVPVMMTNGAVGATGAEIHDPDRGDYAGNFLKSALQQTGYFEGILFSQAENEINSTSTAAALAWRAQWRDINIPHIKAYANQPAGVEIPVFVMLTGKYIGSVSDGMPEATPATIVRREQEALIATAGYYPLSHPVGVELADAVHFSGNNAGYPAYARRAALSVIKTLTGTGYDGRGPLFSTATLNASEIVLPIALNGATSLTSSTGTLTGLTGWQVNSSPDFNGTAYTVSAAVLDTTLNRVTLTLSSPPPGQVYVRNYSGTNNDDSNWVVGNYADALIGTIHSKPIVTAILTTAFVAANDNDALDWFQRRAVGGR